MLRCGICPPKTGAATRNSWLAGAGPGRRTPDPLLVLGAHARSEGERRRFAEAFVLAEHARVEGELAFERAVQAAWARLFPGQLRIAEAASAVASAERYALVVDRDCPDCRRRLRSYLQGPVPVDVYVRGAADDDDLRAWARGPWRGGVGRARRPRDGEPRRRRRARRDARRLGAARRPLGGGRMSGRVGTSTLMLGLALVSGVCDGADRLVVVHDAGGTVPAAPYVARPDLSEQRIADALARAQGRLSELGSAQPPGDLVALPLVAGPLRPGQPERVRVHGLSGTLFAIGSDRASLAWLDAHAAELRARRATGFLVEAPSADVLGCMRERAARHGLWLDPLPGAALAEAYGARSYPFVAEPPR